MAGAMAKAVAPREKEERSKGKKKQKKRTEEEIDTFMFDAMFHANKTMEVIRKLVSDKMPKKEAAEARTRLKSVARILHSREKEKAGNILRNEWPKWSQAQ